MPQSSQHGSRLLRVSSQPSFPLSSGFLSVPTGSGAATVTEEMPPWDGGAVTVGAWAIFSGVPGWSVPQSLEQDPARACQQGPDGVPQSPSKGPPSTLARGKAVTTARDIPAPLKPPSEEPG